MKIHHERKFIKSLSIRILLLSTFRLFFASGIVNQMKNKFPYTDEIESVSSAIKEFQMGKIFFRNEYHDKGIMILRLKSRFTPSFLEKKHESLSTNMDTIKPFVFTDNISEKKRKTLKGCFIMDFLASIFNMNVCYQNFKKNQVLFFVQESCITFFPGKIDDLRGEIGDQVDYFVRIGSMQSRDSRFVVVYKIFYGKYKDVYDAINLLDYFIPQFEKNKQNENDEKKITILKNLRSFFYSDFKGAQEQPDTRNKIHFTLLHIFRKESEHNEKE